MHTYLIQFAQFHEEFRLPELKSLARLERVSLECNDSEYKLDVRSSRTAIRNPFFKIQLESDEDARKLVKRAILIKNIYELWGEGETYEQVHEQVKSYPERWAQYHDVSFKFIVSAFNSTISKEEQLSIINSFSYLDFQGPIDMKNASVQFAVHEDYGSTQYGPGVTPIREHIYMGRLVAPGSRDLVNTYNLKKRKYLGTTSMDAELSLVMANQALAASGKLVYDPFVGTGSFLFTCAHFGAYTLGSDIDGRQIRGKGEGKSVKANVEQYQLQGRVLDSLVFDVCHHPWRTDAWLDAIVTAPYGVRAGEKTPNCHWHCEHMKVNQCTRNREDYYPPTKPYEMSEVVSDLLNFAAKHLRIGGRLVYWLPTVVDEYASTDIPEHPSMVMISNSEQNFGQWARRLITMEKTREWTSEVHLEQVEDEKRPGHYLFREKYFSFGREEGDDSTA
ncbi:tRNA guanosine-2'-O-methyltransferase [Lichtheimia hyalospora FSU 10163]|nr:tRNA guanosine-2'-O-methyltransferase [Lichtheimia hyalospora FSU 10163]